jgi:predicted RNase H-like HicB family nuclease
MYRIWYWATIDLENDGRFIATIPDLEDLAAYGESDKAAVAHVTDLARDRVRSNVEAGQLAPPRRHFAQLPSSVHAKEIGRAIIAVEVERSAASPVPPFSMSTVT